MNILSKKQLLRQEIRQQRDAIPPSQKKIYDEWIVQELYTMIQEKGYQNIHLYLPIGSEINIRPLIQQLLDADKTIICPKTLKNRQLKHLILNSLDEITSGRWGTQHPANNNVFKGKYDLIIVPGLAFDNERFRLGYGGGYYDSFLSEFPNALTVGIGYPFQIVKEVPKEVHDAQLDKILFQTRIKD